MNQLFVGIDAGSRHNVVYIMLPDGSKHSSFTVQNNFGGAQSLSTRVVAALKDQGLSDVVLGLEATSVYGDNLVCFLREDGALGQFNKKIHVLNPKQVKKFKDSYPDLPKNDAVDAFVIADNLRFGRISTAIYMDDYRYKALQTLTRARFFAVQNLTREKQRFMNYLFMKCSALAQEKTFSNNYGATALAVLEEFESPDDLANIDLDKLTAFIAAHGKNRFPHPEKIAKAVQAAARGSYRLPKTVNDSVNQVLSISISSMRAMKDQIKALDKEIERQVANIPHTLTSLVLELSFLPASSPRSAISPGLIVRLRLPNMPVLHGPNISPVNLRLRTPASSDPAIAFSNITCVKLPSPSCVATRSIGATMTLNTKRSTSTSTNARSPSLPENWSGWSSGC